MANLFFSLNGLKFKVCDDRIIVKAIFIILKDFIEDKTFRNKWGGKY